MTAPPDRLVTALADRYRIDRQLGQGGMATVYLAEDIKHDRHVALKVLRPELAAVVGGDRFLGEIRTTANLQHPHILPLFDSGEADGFLFYVMPYVEGETLRDRLDREKQLPIDEAITIATKVAAALQAAHDRGVIHRDVKPANILLQNGEPVVSDFGIALAVQEAGEGRLTETGLSMGTPYYMSPEQATGDRDPDARSDEYSLACMVYEMLTGEPPFQGTTAQAVLARILTGAASAPSEIRDTIPPGADAAVMKGLARLPADRFGSVREFAGALTGPAPVYRPESRAPAPGRRLTAGTLAFVGGAFAIGLAVGGALLGGRSAGAVAERVHSSVPVADGAFSTGIAMNRGRPTFRALDFTPDGSTLVYSANDAGTWAIYRRRLDQPDARMVAGTEGGGTPFLSPDGSEIGFFANGQILRVPLEGGTPVEIADIGTTAVTRSMDWGETGLVAIADVEAGLRTVPAGGGTPEVRLPGALTTPRFLPGGEAVLVTLQTGASHTQRSVLLVDLASQVVDTLLTDASDASYAASGHLVFARQGRLMRVPFDLATRRATGAPEGVLDEVMHAMNGGNTDTWSDVAQYSVTPAGHLAWIEGGVTPGRQSRLGWFDRDGTWTALDFTTGTWVGARLSPTGERLATASALENPGIWVATLGESSTLRRRSRQPAAFMEWAPAGGMIYYTDLSGGFEQGTLFRVRSDGSVPPEQVGPDASGLGPVGWVGESLIALTVDAGDLVRVDTLTGEVAPFLSEQSLISYPAVSQDGQWLLYAAAGEVIVRPLPLDASETRIVVGSGHSPVWGNADASEILLIRGGGGAGGSVVSVPFDPDSGRAGPEVALFDFEALTLVTTEPVRSHDVAGDGRIAAVLNETGVASGPQPPSRINLILNWFDPAG